MTGLATETSRITVQETPTVAILQRLANKDQTAVRECIETYGNLIWGLARKFTASPSEAETATQEIFLDIWKHAANDDKICSDEKLFIAFIAYRRLNKRPLFSTPKEYMKNGNSGNEQQSLINGTGDLLKDSGNGQMWEDKMRRVLNQRRVLYAEDNEDACFMVTMLCDFAGIKVITSRTVAEAWQLAQMETFDLYLLDSRFPDGDGLDLCRRLREFAPHTPILMYSGDAYKTDKDQGMLAGADAYLTKPYLGNLPETILQTIENRKRLAFNIGNNSFADADAKDQSAVST